MLDFFLKRSTIIGVYYANLLDQLRTAIIEKCRGKLTKGVLLQQDNPRVHTCKVAMYALERNRYELIPHPSYSPDIAPSDFFLFPNLKKDIWGCHFQSEKEVVNKLKSWSMERTRLLQFWADGTWTPLVQVHHTRGQLHWKWRVGSQPEIR